MDQFRDPDFIEFTQKGLPHLFQLAEMESRRGGGGAGMEVGTLREQILVALLIRYFGRENISVGRITLSEMDVSVFGLPISIKTITKTTFSGVKAVWTVDSKAITRYILAYKPECSILLVRIHKNGGEGSFHFIPLEVHQTIFEQFGRDRFFKIPPLDTNPRGVEFDKDALASMALHPNSVFFPIQWTRTDIDFDIYHRWVEAWKEIANKRASSSQGSLF
jgi:hypothetical protein